MRRLGGWVVSPVGFQEVFVNDDVVGVLEAKISAVFADGFFATGCGEGGGDFWLQLIVGAEFRREFGGDLDEVPAEFCADDGGGVEGKIEGGDGEVEGESIFGEPAKVAAFVFCAEVF